MPEDDFSEGDFHEWELAPLQATDEHFMRRALSLAIQAAEEDEVPVGR